MIVVYAWRGFQPPDARAAAQPSAKLARSGSQRPAARRSPGAGASQARGARADPRFTTRWPVPVRAGTGRRDRLVPRDLAGRGVCAGRARHRRVHGSGRPRRGHGSHRPVHEPLLGAVGRLDRFGHRRDAVGGPRTARRDLGRRARGRSGGASGSRDRPCPGGRRGVGPGGARGRAAAGRGVAGRGCLPATGRPHARHRTPDRDHHRRGRRRRPGGRRGRRHLFAPGPDRR